MVWGPARILRRGSDEVADATDEAALLAEIGIRPRSRARAAAPLLRRLAALPRGRVLDAPCGPGLLSEALRRKGFRVVAADLDRGAFAAREVPMAALDLDAALPFADGAFDLVVSGDGIEHLENPFAFLRECARVLRRGGRLALATPNYGNLERRLRFLLTGAVAKPLPRPARGEAGEERARGHVSPWPPTRLLHAAESAGLAVEEVSTLLPKRRQWALLPLALAVRVYARSLGARRRRDLYDPELQSLRALLGGGKLLVLLRRRALPR